MAAKKKPETNEEVKETGAAQLANDAQVATSEEVAPQAPEAATEEQTEATQEGAGEAPEGVEAAAEESAPTDEQEVPEEPESDQDDNPETKAEPWKVKRLLKVGKPIMKGDDVKALQTALIARGFNCGVGGVNGIYGKETAHAVRMFQSMNRLIVDGRAGKYTVTKLGGEWEEPKKK